MYKFSHLWWNLGMQTKKSATKSEIITNNSTTSAWIDKEVGGCNFKDVRLAKRFGKLLGMMSEGIGESVPYPVRIGPIPRRLTAFSPMLR